MKNKMLALMMGWFISLGLMGCASAQMASPDKITLQESVGGSWSEDNLHRTIKHTRGQMFPDRIALHAEGEAARSVPMQLANVLKYPDNIIFPKGNAVGAQITEQVLDKK